MKAPKRGPKKLERAVNTPLKGIPDPPANLDAESRSHYKRLTGLMAEAGTISLLDFDALSMYMSLWKRWQDSEKKVREMGMAFKSPNGWLQKNPYLEISQQCVKSMMVFLNMFGLNAASRAKLALPEPEEADSKWSELD